MKKKILVSLITVLAFLQIQGCSGDVTITDEQEDIISQYAAGVMLRYSYENEWKYTKLYDALYGYHKSTESETETSSSKTTTETESTTLSSGSSSGSSSTTTTTTAAASLSDTLPTALGLTSCSITYSKYSVGSSYPLNPDSIYVPAESDRVVVGVEFTIVNNSSAAITANTTNAGVLMKLKVSGTSYTNYATLLKNSLLTLSNVTINAGESYTAVVLFQIPSELEGSVASSTLTATKDGESLGSITLK